MRLERGDVGERGNSARGDDRNADPARQIGRCRGIDTTERSVASNIGMDDRRHTAILEAVGEFDNPDFSRLGPAGDRDAPAAGVDRDDDQLRIIGGGAPNQFGVAQCRGSEHDAVDPEAQPALDRVKVSNAASQLDAQPDGIADRGNRRAVYRMAGKGAVEVDDMEPAEARGFELTRLSRGILVEHRRGRHLAANQANAGTVFEVNRRVEDHGRAGSSSSSL